MLTLLIIFAFASPATVAVCPHRCRCLERSGTLDCARAMLHSLPIGPLNWVTRADFRNNAIIAASLGRLTSTFPNVRRVDLRLNDGLSCLKPIVGIELLSDCEL